MATVVLISCTKSKKPYKCKANEIYRESPRFRLAYKLASSLADKIYILSAKHGLVPEDTVIEPYNETLKDKNSEERRIWAERVVAELKNVSNTEKDEYIVIAGEDYCKNLLPHLSHYWLPLKGKTLGEWSPELERLIKLQEATNKVGVIHMLFNGLPRMDWTMIDNIPYHNGIYIMFEKGQSYKCMDRIVRVGTHRAQDRLKARLKDHFLKDDANGSIFRKNIGRAFLNYNNDPYLKVWELDTSKSHVAESNADLIDDIKELELELKISSYIRENITFVCFPVESAEQRIRIEEGIISTLNSEANFGSVSSWLGLNSPIPEIKASGLWNRQGLKGNPLTNDELEYVKWLVRFSNCSKANKMSNKLNSYKVEDRNGDNKSSKITANDVRQYIEKLFLEAKAHGDEFLDLISGQVHKQLGMKNSMPQVCRIMFEKKHSNDEVLHTTPSNKSSTIKIRYFMKNR